MKKFLTFLNLSLLTSCNPFNYYPDAEFEEEFEDYVFERTGILMDLSGNTPED